MADPLLASLDPAAPCRSDEATPHPDALRRVDEFAAQLFSQDVGPLLQDDLEIAAGCAEGPGYEARRGADGRTGALEDGEKTGVVGTDAPPEALSYSQLLRRMRRLAHEGRHAEAEPLYRRALRLNEATLGPLHQDTLDFVSDLGVLLQACNKLEEAERLQGRAVRGRDTLFGLRHPRTLESVSNLACLLEARGKFAEAEALHRRALEGCEAALGGEHPETLRSLFNLAMLLQGHGEVEEAERLLRRELEGCAQVYGPAHDDTIWSASRLEELLRSQGRVAEADRVAGKAHDSSVAFSI